MLKCPKICSKWPEWPKWPFSRFRRNPGFDKRGNIGQKTYFWHLWPGVRVFSDFGHFWGFLTPFLGSDKRRNIGKCPKNGLKYAQMSKNVLKYTVQDKGLLV